ncbi:hypothetical protein M569_11377, partial [Genlisea aurea]
TARDLWESLERRFGHSVEPQIFYLKGELQRTTQGSVSVVIYYTKLRNLWDQLAALTPFPD